MKDLTQTSNRNQIVGTRGQADPTAAPDGNTGATPFGAAYLEDVKTVPVSGGKEQTAMCSILWTVGDEGVPESNC